jgi:hypothetical protein
MVASQDDFAQSVNDLATLVNNFSQHTDLGRMDFIVGEVCSSTRRVAETVATLASNSFSD